MFENITLELSLKPFKKTDTEYIKNVCRGIFEQWKPLLKDRKTVSVMLWCGDGSEILDYNGNLDDEFEWCRFIGTANLPKLSGDEPLETSLHQRKQDYIENPPKMTYGILKTIVSCLKEAGMAVFPNATVRIGETFDIGPEFAISDFKYNRHTEICSGAKLDRRGFVDATATLSADSHPYAAYPNGIPEGTLFGTFLGKQSEIFLSDMGFDYLWLSNGLGFSSNPWRLTGKIFDGEKYYPEKLAATKTAVFNFWKLFRKECSFPLETRGTNNSVGIDYASDGVPLYDIYNAALDITAPPNSPWAALNDNYGLEVMGHMTRVCELPSDRFPFRYYIHDPWWVNSPWYDRYDGSPCDIYLPMAISRIDGEGKVCSANSLNILSIDNSYGGMPDCCVNEPLPHLLKAEKDIADEPAPFVWVYPMREFTTSQDSDMLKEMSLGDRFICDSINDGFPLCCVTSTDNFLKHSADLYSRSVIVSPIPTEKKLKERLEAVAELGIGVIVYGTEKGLRTLGEMNGAILLNIEDKNTSLRECVGDLGYHLIFDKKREDVKPPTLALSRRDGALLFSVYNANTTTDALYKLPLGAPVLCGMETEMKDGYSSFRFARGEHRECRIFVEQKSGIISCREAPPINARYRRAIKVRGLEDATVRLISERGCECAVATNETLDKTPDFDPRFKTVRDEVYGEMLVGEHIDGNILFIIGKKK